MNTARNSFGSNGTQTSALAYGGLTGPGSPNKTGKTESDVIKIMRRSLKPSSFRLWRKRVNSQSIKHRKKFEYSRKQIRVKIKKNEIHNW